MSKRKKSKATPRQLSPARSGLRFELEPDAEELLHEYLAVLPVNISELKEGDHHHHHPAPKPVRRVAPGFRLDLHGFTLAEAKSEARRFIGEQLAKNFGRFSVTIITGRGLHSGLSGGVLVREIYHFIQSTFRANIVKIDASPAESTLDGLPLRGYFLVHFTSHIR
jgi:DNA-nicking Smr family endonuclease